MSNENPSLPEKTFEPGIVAADGSVATFFQDITERQQGEVAEACLAAIVESSEDAIISTNLDGVLTSWNRGAERLYGYTAEEAIGQPLTMLIPPHLENDESVILERIRQGGTIGHYETVRCRKDRTPVEVSLTVSPIFDAHGQIVGASKIARDITERKRVEAAGERYRLLSARGRDILLFFRPDGALIEVNAAAIAAYGFSEEELLAKSMADLRAPETQAELAAQIAAVRRGPIRFETTQVRRDGARFPVEASWTFDRIGGEEVILSVIRDITERKRAEEAVQRTEQELRDFVENATVGMHWVGADGIILWANRTELQMLGYSREEYLGHHIAKFHADEPVIQDILGRLTRDETLGDYEARLRCKDGSIRDVLINSNVLRENGKFVHTRCFTRDITERKRAEAALRESENRKSAILDGALDTIITMDHQGKVVDFNPAAESTFGIRREEIVGRPMAEKIIPERLRERHYQGLAHYLATGEGPVLRKRIEVPALHADGHEFPVELSINRIAGIEPPMFTATLRDITERQQAEEALRERVRLAALRADISAALVTGETLPAVLQKCAEAVVEHLDAAFARIWTLKETENILELQASAGLYTHLNGPHGRVKVGEFKIGRIAQSTQPLLTNDVLHDPNISDPEWAKREGMVAFAGYPLLLENRVLGVMALFARHPLSQAVLNELAPVADGIAQWVQRKRSEEALRASEERFRSLVSIITDVPWTTDAQGAFVVPQLAWENFTGQSWEEHRGFGWTNALHPEDREAVEEIWEAAKQARSLYEARGRLWHVPSQQYRHFVARATPLFDANGDVRAWVGTCTDCHDAKVAEENAASQKRLLEALTESVLDGILIVSLEGRMIHFNQRFLQIWNFPSSVLEQRSDEAALQWAAGQTADPAAFLGGVAAAYATPDKEIREELLMADGRVYERCGSPVHLAGAALGWVWTFRDMTERRASVEHLRIAKEQAESALRAKDDFLAALSHELRTPLTPVLMTASAMEGDTALPQEVRDQLGMVRRNVELQARLIDDLLDITRITRGKLNLAPIAADLHQLLEHTAEIVRSDELGKQVRVVFSLEAERHHALADPARLQQVFWNLIKNALKFTPTGGTIAVRTRNDAEGRILVSVEDNGVGISAEALPQIFRAFEQGDAAGQHRYGGLGLGLAISQAIVEAHGGTIQADSKGVGLGATFTVILASVEAPAELPPAITPPSAPAPALRLLVVEDHEATRTVLTRLLTRSGHQVTTASTIHEALLAFSAERFDAVVSDLGLPDGSGLDLMREIQRRRPVPGIALSGYGMEDDLRQTKEAGFTAHLVKPVNLDQLRQVLAQLATRV